MIQQQARHGTVIFQSVHDAGWTGRPCRRGVGLDNAFPDTLLTDGSVRIADFFVGLQGIQKQHGSTYASQLAGVEAEPR
jgi:hypothetical protein